MQDELMEKILEFKEFLEDMAEDVDTMGDFLTILSSGIVSFALTAPGEDTSEIFIKDLVKRLQKGFEVGLKLKPSFEGMNAMVSVQVGADEEEPRSVAIVEPPQDATGEKIDENKLEAYARCNFPGKPVA